MNIRKFAIVITTLCAVFFLGNCSQEKNIAAPHSAPQQNLTQSAADDPSHCMGRELLDTWAYYASASPTFVMALSGKGETQPIAKPYFNAEIKTALRNFKSGKRDDNTGLSFNPAGYWDTDKKTNILHTQLLPAAYLAMCTQDIKWAKDTLLAAEKLLKKNPDTFLLQRLIWEIELFIGLTRNEPDLLWALLSEIDTYVTQHAEIDPYEPFNPKVRSATDPVDNTRLLAFIARTRSRYSLMANDYTNFLISQEEFVMATERFGQFGISRTPLHQISHWRVTSIHRIGRASAAHHWVESIVLQLQLRPSWLRQFKENTINYEKRMKLLIAIDDKIFCSAAKEIRKSIAVKRRVLQCLSNKPINLLPLTKKRGGIVYFYHASRLFSKIVLFEDNRHFWGQHQYLRYQFFKKQVDRRFTEKHKKQSPSYIIITLVNFVRQKGHMTMPNSFSLL